MSRLPLPPLVTAKIAAFLDAKQSGTITLQVREGVVMSYELADKGTVRTEPEPVRRV